MCTAAATLECVAGEFDSVFLSRSAAAPPPVPSWRRASRISPSAARTLLLQGRTLHDIAEELGVTTPTAFKHVLTDAEQEGPSSQLWRLLLNEVQLPVEMQQRPSGLSAAQMFDAMQSPIEAIGSDLRMKPIREHLLSSASGVADQMQHQEARDGGAGITYNQLRVLLAMRKVQMKPDSFEPRGGLP